MTNLKEKIELLKDYSSQNPEIVMAFVFGSRIEDRLHAGSDWDIAVYFTPQGGKIEWEDEGREYPEEERVLGDCINILKTDNVDLIVLNRASARIAETAIRGMPLVIKDRRLFLEFMLIVTKEAEDYRRTSREYAEIYWRSKSLSEKDVEALERRSVFIDTELSALPEYAGLTWDEYQKNHHKRREVERLIENLMNAAIDVAKIILASEKRTVPSTYREMLRLLGTVVPFSRNMAERLSGWAGLRNILAHEYLDLRWKPIHDFLEHGESHFRTFLQAAKEFLAHTTPQEGS
jgi:uncharacterized protein YutE (UPF0331/DUF86 family)